MCVCVCVRMRACVCECVCECMQDDKVAHVARLTRLLGMPVGVLNAGNSFLAMATAFSFKI